MGKKILIVEDNAEEEELLSTRLMTSGYDVISASDAIFAVKEAHENKPDLVILDLLLPGGGGKAVLERLKLSVKTKKIPILVLSGLPQAEYGKILQEYGVKAYIQKPFEPKELLDTIHKLLNEETSDTKSTATKSKRILVVDDDPNIVDLLSTRLSANGYAVVTAVDGEDALKQLDTADPDLIIADLMMPNLNGWQFSLNVKERKKDKKLPIIILSALVDKEGPSTKIEVGDYYLPKPFEPEKLLAKVKEFLKDT